MQFIPSAAMGAFAAGLTEAETAIVATVFALISVVVTIVVLRHRDRILAERTPVTSQPWITKSVDQTMTHGSPSTHVPSLSIPGYCPNCGMAMKPMARFCERCGRRLA